MKNLLPILALLCSQNIKAQDPAEATQLVYHNQKFSWFVQAGTDTAIMHEIGHSRSFRGGGLRILSEDTLFRQPDGNFTGRKTRLRRNGGWELITQNGKKYSYKLLQPAGPIDKSQLNSAWYNSRQVSLCQKLSARFPQWRCNAEVLHIWGQLPGEALEHTGFRDLAEKQLRNIEDSVINVEERKDRITRYIGEHIRTMEFSAVTDSLYYLQHDKPWRNHHFRTAIDSIAMHQPAYFYRLAEALPEQRSNIFYEGAEMKKALPGLQAVEGHDAMKTEFLKDRKSQRKLPYVAIASATAGMALLVLAVVSLK